MGLISGKLVGSVKKPKTGQHALHRTKKERMDYLSAIDRIQVDHYGNTKKVKPIEGELTEFQKMALERKKKHEQQRKDSVKRANDSVILSLIAWAMGNDNEENNEKSI